MQTDEDQLTFAVAFAIWKASRKRIDLDNEARIMAAVVIKQLRLSGWNWTKTPPREPH